MTGTKGTLSGSRINRPSRLDWVWPGRRLNTKRKGSRSDGSRSWCKKRRINHRWSDQFRTGQAGCTWSVTMEQPVLLLCLRLCLGLRLRLKLNGWRSNYIWCLLFFLGLLKGSLCFWLRLWLSISFNCTQKLDTFYVVKRLTLWRFQPKRRWTVNFHRRFSATLSKRRWRRRIWRFSRKRRTAAEFSVTVREHSLLLGNKQGSRSTRRNCNNAKQRSAILFSNNNSNKRNERLEAFFLHRKGPILWSPLFPGWCLFEGS